MPGESKEKLNYDNTIVNVASAKDNHNELYQIRLWLKINMTG